MSHELYIYLRYCTNLFHNRLTSVHHIELTFVGRKGYPCFKLDKHGCMGSNKARMHPELKNETVQYLQKHFEPILKTFKHQTGMKLKSCYVMDGQC